jgi:tripartite-type tricarboxylate transporter receptor subunit TctC
VLGAELTKNAAPDGYTLFIGYHQHTINAAILPKLPYHAVNDFTPVTQMTEAALLLIVNLNHPSKTLKEFVEWTKTTKDPINFGSAGIGSGRSGWLVWRARATEFTQTAAHENSCRHRGVCEITRVRQARGKRWRATGEQRSRSLSSIHAGRFEEMGGCGKA